MAYCELTGTAVGYDGQSLKPGTVLKAFSAASTVGTIIASIEQTYRLQSDGTWTPPLRFERASIAKLYMAAPGFDADPVNGTPMPIPDAAGAALATIPAPADFPDTVPVAVTFGAINEASPRSWTGRHIISVSPVFDLAGDALGVGTLMPYAGATVPTGKVFSIIRITQADGSDSSFTVLGTGVVAGIHSSIRALADSDAGSALYSAVLHVVNEGPGTVKAVHGRAEGVTGSTGPLVAGNFQVTPVAGQGSSWAVQVITSGVDNKAVGMAFANESGANWLYGIDLVANGGNMFDNAGIRLTNDTPIVGRNAADDADVVIVKLNADNETEFGSTPVNNIANPLFRLGDASTGWQVQKVDADSRFRILKNSVGEALAIYAALYTFIANTTSAPAGTPTGGGYLYVEGGSLKFKGSSGTVTTIAPA